MKKMLLIFKYVCISLFLFSSIAAADERLSHLRSFAFALGADTSSRDTLDRLKQFDLIVVDGANTSAREVAELKTRSVVLGYVSVGTIEKGRRWFRQAKPFRLELWGDWGEWYADVAKPGFQNLISRSVAPAILKKGFDGLFLDNVDMIASHPRQKRGMRILVRALARLVHSRSKYLFAQNGEDVIAPMVSNLDGWNREDVTSTYNFASHRYELAAPKECARRLDALAWLKAEGKVVTATDYVASGNVAVEAQSHENACSRGALSFVSDIYLKRLPEAPFVCP